MSPPNKERLDQIRDERTTQIKQAALKIFARNGFNRTKTSMIAAAAGISEGLIFRYFKSKDILFSAIVEELMEDAASEIGHSGIMPGTPYEQIRSLTANMLDDENKFAFMLILKARKTENLPPRVTEIFERYSNDRMLDQLLPIVIKGQELGEFIQGDPKQLLSWYLCMINSLILQEQGDETYGFPEADVLMKILSK
ncbi:TetR/AcrR family transcriptional regulator [Paenibacillus lycopersici]|uniref:TetR/AcrR family transcriptional regulator n=1 Tax=Paenibacillus lycopersici TaxID=2704462 RepID=A0A6C0G1K1_9BACL|nr:TetR/AcrR family transcriptional regulator [Paenibacillus lycopersici]QHT61234.1 TetR/AcrR family transcriptional regulator [Paenibacillus lycopersici]